jgi:pimeloyl-ACP methyl ester carboxylesterase
LSWAIFSRDGLALRYFDVGVGAPVLFQHGLGGDHAQVEQVFPSEPAIRRITLECRGQGGSDFGPESDLSIATFADDLSSLAARLGVTRAIVGGISMGAAISLSLAVRRPDLVAALVLARPAWIAGPAPSNLRPYAIAGELMSRFEPMEARRRFEATDVAAQMAREAPDNLASLIGFFGRSSPRRFGSLLCAIAADGPNVSEEDIGRLAVPTLVIGHRADLAHPFAAAQKLASLIPGAELAAITPKGHSRERYVEDFRGALRRFLEETTPT